MGSVRFEDLSEASAPHHFLHLNNSSNVDVDCNDKNNQKENTATNDMDNALSAQPSLLPSLHEDVSRLNIGDGIDANDWGQRESETQIDSSCQPLEDRQANLQAPNITTGNEHCATNHLKLSNEQQLEQSQPQSNSNDSVPPTTASRQAPLPPHFDAATNMFSFMDDGFVASFFENVLPRPQPSFAVPDVERNEVDQGAPTDFLYSSNVNFDEYPTPSTDNSPPTANETESHDSGGGTDTLGLVEGRVEASKMGEVENPLQKRGRHTVITGHLPYDNPYSIAERNLGIKMCSLKMQSTGVPSGMSREEAFARDLHEFLVEINLTGYKVPVIGGGPLDLFALMREVLLLGGVTNVVKKRAFRIVGQQLELPKSCTSAAFVLKNAYTRLLFYYEGKLVFDQTPENPCRNVNIKQIVAADKERDRIEAKIRNGSNAPNAAAGIRRRDDRKRRMSDSIPNMTMYSMQNDTVVLQDGVDYEETFEIDATNLNDEQTAKRARLSSEGEQQSGMDEFIKDFGSTVGVPTPLGAAADYEFSQEYYMSLVSNNSLTASDDVEVYSKLCI